MLAVDAGLQSTLFSVMSFLPIRYWYIYRVVVAVLADRGFITPSVVAAEHALHGSLRPTGRVETNAGAAENECHHRLSNELVEVFPPPVGPSWLTDHLGTWQLAGPVSVRSDCLGCDGGQTQIAEILDCFV